MKKIIISIFVLFLLISCSKKEEEIVENKIANLSQIIEICKTECGSDSDSYCLGEKTFINNAKEIKGTCRSFGKYNIGIPKCEGFCKQYGKNNVKCKNEDGTVNLKCN